MTTHLMDDPRRPPATDGEIARRAYGRWVNRCREADASLLDWLEAEAELRGKRETADRFAELDERLNSLLAARREAERRLATEHAVSGILANSSALADAAPQVITAICECLGWDMGLLWRVDEQAGVLRCVEVCRGPTSTADDFERDTRGRSFPPGVGLPGQVWAAETLVWVSDVTAGTLFPRGPAAFRAGLRAAVGFPVRNGCEFLGVMEFFSREIQQPDDALIQMMNSIGRQISQFIERRQAEAEVCRQAEDRRLARCIQQGLLPKRPPVLPGFEIAGRSTAAEEVGGDCFDFLPMPAGGRPGLGVLVADASGHGIGAALLMAETRAYLRALALTETDAGRLLTLGNRGVAADLVTDDFLSVFLMRLDADSRSLEYAGAGHWPGYVLDRRGHPRQTLSSTGSLLGIDPAGEFPLGPRVVLESGELVLLFTDGLVEADSEDEGLFGVGRLLDVVRDHRHETPDSILDALFDAVSRFTGRRPRDDMTAVIVKVAGGL